MVNWLASMTNGALENLPDAGKITIRCGYGFGLLVVGRLG